MALERLRYDSTVVSVSSGSHMLESATKISYKNHIAIIGSGVDETEIVCNSSAGIEISSSSDVKIDSITFNGCGQEHHLQIQTTSFDFFFVYHIPASLYFNNCHTVLLYNVSIVNSRGSGLLINHVSGNVTVSNCLVTDCYGDMVNNKISHCSYYDYDYNYYDYTITDMQCFERNDEESVYSDDSLINQSGGGIVVFNPSGMVDARSCALTNNSKGFVILSNDNYGVSFNVSNDAIPLNHESSLIITDSSFTSTVNLLHQITTDHIKAVPSIQYTKNVNFVWFKSTFMSISFQGSDCNDFDWQHRCVDSKGFKATCPVSYFNYCSNITQTCHANRDSVKACGHCNDGYSVPINSPSLSCAQCHPWKGWMYLILLEFIPVTVMVATIAIVNVNLNQGSLKAFILFSQIISIPFPSAPLTGLMMLSGIYLCIPCGFIPFPFSIWNLDFVNILYLECDACNDDTDWGPEYEYHLTTLPICISHSTTPLLAISFWYMIGFYPFVLLALIYFCIFLYDRGYRCVVCIIRPVHRLLARFWRMFGIQPSLTHTVASVYTLCFTQIAAVSLKILHPSLLHGNSSKPEAVFYYDGSQPYFYHWHGLAVVFAATVLIMFIIIPSIYLTIYPFKWFQKCFNKVKIKKDFFISVTDVFMGPFKDGTQNSWDYRHLAGIYFGFQLLLMTFNYILCPGNWCFFIIVIGNCVTALFAVTIIIFRPYKRNIHTFTQVILFASFMVLFWFASSPIVNCLHILNLFAFLYFLYWVIKRCKYGFQYCRLVLARNSNNPQPPNIGNQDEEHIMEEDDGAFADRIMNPGGYNAHRVYNAPSCSLLKETASMNADYKSCK